MVVVLFLFVPYSVTIVPRVKLRKVLAVAGFESNGRKMQYEKSK